MLANNYLFNYFSVTPFCNAEPHGIRGLQPITQTWLLKLLFLKYPPPLPAQQRLQTFRRNTPSVQGSAGFQPPNNAKQAPSLSRREWSAGAQK